MLRQSNTYLIFYAAALTTLCGMLLAFASEALKPKQKRNQELERKAVILQTAGVDLSKTTNLEALYNERVKAFVINTQGELVDGTQADDVNIAKEYRKPSDQRLLPVYEVLEADKQRIQAYVLPMYGNGLWDAIWGYIAIAPDLNTVVGVSFDHKSETPGLGARITDREVRDRFKGKSLFNQQGELVGIAMQKGEKGNEVYANDPHKVDGLSGATLTSKGVNDMIFEYMRAYQAFFQKQSTSKPKAL